MRIVQAVFGVFHHFELARQLDRRGHLERIYSTWPWQRLKREGLPHAKVETFPWLHTAELALYRSRLDWTWATDQLGYLNALAFDEWLDRRIPASASRRPDALPHAQPDTQPDALIAISGAALKAGRHLQQNGGLFLCDRGSSHQRYQEQIVSDEYRRWGVAAAVSDLRDTLREEAIYEAADAITVPSRFAARSFVELGIPAAKLHVIPYGVRLESFQPVSAPPDLAQNGRFEVLFVGQVSLRKGVPYLLEAFAKLQHPNKRLRVVGALQPSFAEVLSRLPQQQVEFLGSVPQAELPAILSSSHVLVLPSIEEGLALVQGQALACGCPVLCSTNSGGEDLITDGVEGWVVPIRDADAICDRLERLAGDPALQATMRQSALARVQTIGGWDAYGDQWESLLTRLLAARQS